MEEVFGEYILNLSNENLKIAALRGRIKLENVQLDGDMIGSHVLNAVGLQSTSFGILSCSVQSMHVIIPWNKLEQEASKMILDGVHMVCVPLVPLTAHKKYGAGTKTDPQCTLRTRLKRLLLSRLERNFWNGLYAEEGGPPMKRIQRAVEDIKRDMVKTKKQQQGQGQNTTQTDSGGAGGEENGGPGVGGTVEDNVGEEWLFQTDGNDLPELPRDWKVKIREKLLRNMEASMHNVHIRVEVPERGLDFNQIVPRRKGVRRTKEAHEDASPDATATNETNSEIHEIEKDLSPEERAFCFGFTLDSLVVRTANEEWKAGRHDTTNPQNGSQMSSVKGNLGPNPYVVKNNKIGYFSKLSMYWDQAPPLLLAETDLMRQCRSRGSNSSSSGPRQPKLSAEKWRSRIAEAMQSLFDQQEPGKAIRQSLGAPPSSPLLDEDGSTNNKNMDNKKYPHVYLCKDLDAEIRVRTSERTLPGPISCSADVIPFSWDFSLRPHQYKQYNLLRAAIQRQQRLDTMLRQRPDETPTENPRSWWQYAIGCVTARPTSRPWKDVQVICQKRSRYMELVQRKNKHRISSNSSTIGSRGFHAGLSDSESEELLSLEELLPLEALQALHLIALRQVYQMRKHQPKEKPHEKQPKPRGLGRFRFLKKKHRRRDSRGSAGEFTMSSLDDDHTGGSTIPNTSSASEDDDEPLYQKRGERTTEDEGKGPTDSSTSQQSVSLMQAMTIRLGNKVWFIDWRFHDISLNVSMLVNKIHLASLNLKARGNVRSFGKAKRDLCFDVTQCDIVHEQQRILYVKSDDDDLLTELDEHFPYKLSYEEPCDGSLSSMSRSQMEEPANPCMAVPTIRSLLHEKSGRVRNYNKPDLKVASTFLDLPPSGVVCRIVAGMHTSTHNISISSHPATFLWTNTFMDGIQRFQETNPDLGQRMRNAATPLARKAQLALIQPGSRAIHLNIMAPKIWIPIASSHDEQEGGTLVLDAGAVRLQGEKQEGETDMMVNFRANDFQARFVRTNRGGGLQQTIGSSSGDLLLWNGQSATGIDTTIVRPFNVTVNAQTHTEIYDQDLDASFHQGQRVPVRSTEVHISPISLNLVDAEVLARALGKWYALSVARVSRRRENRRENSDHQNSANSGSVLQPLVDRSQRLSVNVDKIEIAIEGHSKRRGEDDRSTSSLDSLHDSSPPIRAYLVEIDAIEVTRTSHGLMAATRLLAQNASILRLHDGAGYAPLRKRRDPVDSQYRILVRSSVEQQHQQGGVTGAVGPVLRASLLHDGKNHLDEVEVDIDSVVLRVTITTLKDCVKASRRLAEVAQLATREMERKVHEEGRKARLRDSLVGGTFCALCLFFL